MSLLRACGSRRRGSLMPHACSVFPRAQVGGHIIGEAAEMATGELVAAMAGSVLEMGIEEPHIARLRGLPWNYGIKEVCEFLSNVNVNLQPAAVTMLHNAAGEAFVTLSTAAQLGEVLQANHQEIGRRYVEIFTSNSEEKQAACERNRATMRDDADYRGVLRMRGLPFSTSPEDILVFFGSPPTLQLSNVHLMRKADGRSSGDAYAVFDTEEAAVEALQYDKQKLGSRWVDLFQSNKGELYSLTSLGGIMLGQDAQAGSPVAALGDGYWVVKLRGLPWSVTLENIAIFLNGITIPKGGVHLMNGVNGRPSGLAYVELSSEEDQKEALCRDKQSIGGRYIDVFACSQTELQARLAGGLERGGLPGNSGSSSTADAHFVKLRGLPYQINEQQISAFFQPLFVVAVQIAFNPSRQPSGFGYVQFRTPEDTTQALHRTNQVLGSRYVEIFRCTRAEMEQARMHALTVMPSPRGHGGAPPAGQRGGGGGRAHPSESAYAAYQAALQTLAMRQHHSGYTQQGGYASGGGYHGAEYAVANGALSAANGNGSYAAGYGSGADVYSGTAGGYGQSTGGYAQGSGGYGQVAGGYGPTAGSGGAGYGTHAPAPAGYASAAGNSSQYYPPQAAAATGGAQGYTAADYANYSNYYYSSGTYQ